MNRSAHTYTFRAAERQYRDAGLGTYHAFAIEAVNEKGEIVAELDDFSPDREEAASFAALITEEGLDPLHLLDAAEDYLLLAYHV